MAAEGMRMANLDDEHIGIMSDHVLSGRPSIKAEVQKELQPYKSFKDEIRIIDEMAMEGTRKIQPAALQDKALKQLHPSYRCTENTRLLRHKSIYWVKMNADIGKAIKIASYVFPSRQQDLRTEQCHTKYQEYHGNL